MVENQENQSHPRSDGSGFLFGNAGQMRILRRNTSSQTLSAPHFHALTILLGIRQILKVHCFVIVFSDDLLDFL